MKCPVCNSHDIEITNSDFLYKITDTLIGKGSEYYCNKCENYFTWDHIRGTCTEENIQELKREYFNQYNASDNLEE